MTEQKKVYSRFDVPKTIQVGNFPKEIDVYSEEIDKDGKHILKKIGKHNFYKEIQEHKDETMVYNLLDRFQHGDVNALSKAKNTMYGDFTQAPKTIQEAQNQIIKAKNEFEKLPLNVRKEFNHNANEFLASAQQGDLMERIKKAQGIEKEIQIPNITKPQTINPGTIPGQQELNPGTQTGGIKYE